MTMIRGLAGLLVLAIFIMPVCHARPDAGNDALADAGERIYRTGVLLSGQPLPRDARGWELRLQPQEVQLIR